MKLNRTGTQFDREYYQKEDENWGIIEGNYNNVVSNISDEAYQQVVDSAKLIWQDPVETFADISTTYPNAEVGYAVMTRDTGKIYRFDGGSWNEIQDIDPTAINEVDSRLSSQLADEANSRITTEKNAYHGYYEGAVVSFAFDDAAMTDWDRFKPIFESEGVPGVVAVITSQVGKSDHGYESMTWEQLKQLKSMGWTIASHTHRHLRPSEMTEEEIDYELRESSRLLQEHGLDYDVIVYPFGDTSNGLLETARKYYKMGINIVRYFLPDNLPPDIDNLNLGRKPGLSQELDSGELPTLDQCKSYVDDAIAKGDYIIFEDHAGTPPYNTQEGLDNLRELIQYIKSKGVPIVNAQDGFNMKCNVVDVYYGSNNYFRLHRNGKISQSDLSFENQSRTGNDHLDDTPSSFRTRKITVDRFTGDQSHTEKAYRLTGIRYTHKMVDAPNSWFQEVHTPSGYFIRWAIDSDNWGAFEEVSNLVGAGQRSGTNYDDPPSSFEVDKVTVDRLVRDLNHPLEAYQENSIRYTHKEVDAPNTVYQEVINKNGKYIRFTDGTSGGWGDFKKIDLGLQNDVYGVTIESFSLSANSTVDVDLDVPGVKWSDELTMLLLQGVTLPSGVMWNVLSSKNDTVTVRFANITSSSIVIPEIDIGITVSPRLGDFVDLRQ